MSFGWSAGDILAAISTSSTSKRIFDHAGGAVDGYMSTEFCVENIPL